MLPSPLRKLTVPHISGPALCAPGARSVPALRHLTWPLQVSRPVMESVPYALHIETAQCCLTLSARYGTGTGRDAQPSAGTCGCGCRCGITFLPAPDS